MDNADNHWLLKGIAKRSLEAKKERDGDFVGRDGILYCGKCGMPRRMWLELPSELRSRREGDRILVGIPCDCDKREEEEAERRVKAENDIRLVQDLRSASLMDYRMKEASFSSCTITQDNRKNLSLCKRYAERFDQMVEKNQGLLFWGDVGTGKSFAAACIANYLLDKKIPVVMTSFVKLVDMLGFDSEKNQNIINRINRAKLVIFDDFGAERGTDTALERVYNIIDSRYRRGLPMILTTNRDFKDMQNEPDIRYNRIYDRVFETCYPMCWTGNSWRKKAAARSWVEMESLLGVES